MLDELYSRLGKAKDAKSAEPIAESIEHLWQITGSATIDLLIDRAKVFGDGADQDLSIEILDAAADLAPDTPEVWYQRGRTLCRAAGLRTCRYRSAQGAVAR